MSRTERRPITGKSPRNRQLAAWIGGFVASLCLWNTGTSHAGGDGQYIEISGVRSSSNSVGITVTCPRSFTNRLDVFVCTNLFQCGWLLASSNLAVDATNCLNWSGSVTGQLGKACYIIIGNADLDEDGDGTPDAREKLLYRKNPALTDNDGDGLPDWWEIRYFGNLNQGPHDDPDHDGWDNIAEFQRGGNPVAAMIGDTNGALGFQVLTPLRQ